MTKIACGDREISYRIVLMKEIIVSHYDDPTLHVVCISNIVCLDHENILHLTRIRVIAPLEYKIRVTV